MVTDALCCKNKVVMEMIEEEDKRELIELKNIDANVEIGSEVHC